MRLYGSNSEKTAQDTACGAARGRGHQIAPRHVYTIVDREDRFVTGLCGDFHRGRMAVVRSGHGENCDRQIDCIFEHFLRFDNFLLRVFVGHAAVRERVAGEPPAFLREALNFFLVQDHHAVVAAAGHVARDPDLRRHQRDVARDAVFSVQRHCMIKQFPRAFVIGDRVHPLLAALPLQRSLV